MEPAIPPYLQQKRTQPLYEPSNFTGPLTDALCVVFDPKVEDFVIVYIGVQRKPGTDASGAIKSIRSLLAGSADFVESAFGIDPQGYANSYLIAYWRDSQDYDQFADSSPKDWWHPGLKVNGAIGVSFERYIPNVRDVETTYSHQVPEGWAHIADHITGPSDTHEYTNAMIDRVPRGQTENLESKGEPRAADFVPGEDTLGKLVHITAHENICVIRSGSDWTTAEGKDRIKFVKGMIPVLDKGMEELKNTGMDSQCYFNRFIALDGYNGEKYISYSAWRSIYDLSAWIQGASHRTIQTTRKSQLGNQGSDVKLCHENMVLHSEDQEYAYFNCHKGTGMLRAFS